MATLREQHLGTPAMEKTPEMGKKETPQEINNLGNQEILGNHRKGQLDVHDREG